jgi:hypothetical protein
MTSFAARRTTPRSHTRRCWVPVLWAKREPLTSPALIRFRPVWARPIIESRQAVLFGLSAVPFTTASSMLP